MAERVKSSGEAYAAIEGTDTIPEFVGPSEIRDLILAISASANEPTFDMRTLIPQLKVLLNFLAAERDSADDKLWTIKNTAYLGVFYFLQGMEIGANHQNMGSGRRS